MKQPKHTPEQELEARADRLRREMVTLNEQLFNLKQKLAEEPMETPPPPDELRELAATFAPELLDPGRTGPSGRAGRGAAGSRKAPAAALCGALRAVRCSIGAGYRKESMKP